MAAPVGRVAVVISGDPDRPPVPEDTRYALILAELGALGLDAQLVVYDDRVASAVREQLMQMDAVLVWRDPIVEGTDRSVLDALLRDVASQGVFVSAHPDVILKMGTKGVLYRTRGMAWGTDTRLYATWDELSAELPALLMAGPRVLKQHRGQSGNGVWKVEAATVVGGSAAAVRVQHAQRGAPLELLPLATFLERCRPYFDGAGCMVDQPYQARHADGMIRCYFVHDELVGFGHQLVTALLPPEPGAAGPPEPSTRIYYGPSKPEFQRLRRLLEGGWVEEMQQLLGIDRTSLPLIWDADFLLGPRTPDGQDTYVLCEINASCVSPMPDEAAPVLAASTLVRVLEARTLRP